MAVDYEAGGKVVTKWRDLHSVGRLGDQVFFLKGDGWSKAVHSDFSRNGFDRLAREKQLSPGESIMGWVLFELDEEIRTQVPMIKELEVTLTNSFGEQQTVKSPAPQVVSDISAGELHSLKGYHDFSKVNATLAPRVDIERIVRQGNPIRVGPSEGDTAVEPIQGR
jgi:hypothetical protein